MTNKDNRAELAAELRRKAEEIYLKRIPSGPENLEELLPGEIRQILHELRVHQIEMEMQNEELRRAQEELGVQRERYFNLYDLAPVGYVVVSVPGLILETNLTFCAMIGALRRDMPQLPFSRFVYKDDQDLYYLHRKLLLATGERQGCELRLVNKDGDAVWARLDTEMGKAAAGADELRMTVQDISARKRAEARKDELFADLEEKDREMSSFLYSVTHDLRTPLINIQGYSEQLGKYLKELQAAVARAAMPEELKNKVAVLMAESVPEAMRYVADGTLKMGQLLAALLKVTRIGRIAMSPELLNMNAILKSVSETFSFQLDKIGGALKVELLPQCRADALLINQVFENLIGNSVKYRDPGRKLEIIVTGRRLDAHTSLYTVRDNGQGIRAEELDKIWNLFYRGKAGNSDAENGEGIGLTIAKRIVTLSGGKIRAESKEGESATFYIELPG